jgi:hypothetical protein
MERTLAIAAVGTPDFAVVIVGWNSVNGQVTAVTDTAGNTYQLAAPKLSTPTFISQTIYYAAGITPGQRTVRVTWNAMVTDPDVRVVEYSGLAREDTVDAVASMMGTAVGTSSGVAMTNHGHELLVASNTVHTTTVGPGNGFQSRGITNFGDIVEDRVSIVPGPYSASAPINSVGEWVMQLVAFRGR